MIIENFPPIKWELVIKKTPPIKWEQMKIKIPTNQMGASNKVNSLSVKWEQEITENFPPIKWEQFK